MSRRPMSRSTARPITCSGWSSTIPRRRRPALSPRLPDQLLPEALVAGALAADARPLVAATAFGSLPPRQAHRALRPNREAGQAVVDSAAPPCGQADALPAALAAGQA